MRNCSQKVSIVILCLVCAVIAHAGGKKKHHSDSDVKIEVKAIEPNVTYKVSREVAAGRLVKVDSGTPGSVTRTYHLTMEQGKVVDKTLVKEERTEPKPAIFLIGRAGFASSRGSFVRRKVLTMSATAYPAHLHGCSRTASGRRAGYGIVSVDPRTIKLGTLVYVEGYGLAIAADTGGAIKKNRIDLCYGSESQCEAFGRHRVRVHILN